MLSYEQNDMRRERGLLSSEVAYLESRAIKLMYQKVFQYMHEENLTLFEDNIVTAQAASIFLDFKSQELGGKKFLVLPVDFLQQNTHDVDKCVRLLRASSLLPFETSEVQDFDNLLLVIGSDNLPDNPPTLFIVRNLRQAGGKSPVIHVWKSSESFTNHSMIKGGLTNREIQVQIMLRRVLSHRLVGQGKSYTIDTLPSHTILVNPNFTDRVGDSQESQKARSLLQNASNFAAKLRGNATNSDRDASHIKKGNEVHPSDSEFLGASPLTTLITAFLCHGLDPMLQEPRGSLSKVKSVQEMAIQRQDFCDVVGQMREFLYCFYDTEYFEHGDQKNQTLTQSMLIEQISMSPYRRQAQVSPRREEDEEDEFQPRRVRKSKNNRRPKRASYERSHSQNTAALRESVEKERSSFQRGATTPELMNQRQPVPPFWSSIEQKEERPEILTATPHQSAVHQYSVGQESPTKELMDKHHGSDALTAYQHQIKVYRPGDGNEIDFLEDEQFHQEEADDVENKDEFQSDQNSEEDNEYQVKATIKPPPQEEKKIQFDQPKLSLGVIPPTMQVYNHFTQSCKGTTTVAAGLQGESSRLDTQRSSGHFGDGTFNQNSIWPNLQTDQSVEAGENQAKTTTVTEETKRPPMFPLSDDEETKGGPKRKEKKVTSERVAVPKAKQKKPSNSKVRKKGDAIIQQILQNFQSKQPQALRTQMQVRSKSRMSDESSGERALVKLHQLAMGKRSKDRKPRNQQQLRPPSQSSKGRGGSTSQKRAGSKGSKKQAFLGDKNSAFRTISDQLHGMADLEAIASYTTGSLTSRPKQPHLRVKKSPPRLDSNFDNMIPVLKNEKDQFSTKNEVLVNLQHKLKQDLKRSNSRSLSSGQGRIGDGIAIQNERCNNMWDIQMDGPSGRVETLEVFQPAMLDKCGTEKTLPIKKQIGMKKKQSKQQPRGNSKTRLQFIIKGEKISDPKHEVDPSLRKRKEIIQELRLSAAKIVIESQEKAKKATKNRPKEPQTLTQQLHKMRSSHLSSQMITTLDHTPIALLASGNEGGADGHAPAVMSPTRMHFASQNTLPKASQTQKLSKKQQNNKQRH